MVIALLGIARREAVSFARPNDSDGTTDAPLRQSFRPGLDDASRSRGGERAIRRRSSAAEKHPPDAGSADHQRLIAGSPDRANSLTAPQPSRVPDPYLEAGPQRPGLTLPGLAISVSNQKGRSLAPGSPESSG
jgi:hypothetical protein